MPSSLICCSEDSCELEQLHKKAQGTNKPAKQDERLDGAFFLSVSEVTLPVVAFTLCTSSSRGFCPVVAALASLIDEVDSPPSLDSFGRLRFPLSGIFRYFLDLKTPESAGSAAAHQIYRLKTHII